MVEIPKGETKVCFYSSQRCITPSIEYAKQLAVDKILLGWKVGIEQDTKTKEYTVYWGA